MISLWWYLSLQCRCERLPQNNQCSDILQEEYYYARDAWSIEAESIVRTAFQILVDNDTCSTFMKTLLCFYYYLPCDVTSSKLLPFCDARCSELDGMLKKCDIFSPQLIIDPNLGFSTFNCSNPETYFTNIPFMVSNTSCSKLYFM